jgi:transcriptional regulator with XRE-family HTH domain
VTNLKAIGARVKSLRKAQPGRNNQDDLAAMIGTSRSTIAGIEAGTDRGGIEIMIALADYFKVPMDWLLCRDLPAGGPLAGQFVNNPDELSWLAFWRALSVPDRKAVTRLLHISGDDSARA